MHFFRKKLLTMRSATVYSLTHRGHTYTRTRTHTVIDNMIGICYLLRPCWLLLGKPRGWKILQSYDVWSKRILIYHKSPSFIEFGRGGGRTWRISQGMNLEVDFLGTLNSFQAFTRYYRENSIEVLSYRCMRTQWALAVNKDSYGIFVLCEQGGPYRESSQRGGGVMVVPQYASCVSYHSGKMAKL